MQGGLRLHFYISGDTAGFALHINSNDQSNNSRCCGFRGALPGDCTIQEIKTRSGISPITFEGGYAAAADHLDIFRECTAVLAANDAAAIGMISALQECGLKVPGDISVIGINDIPMCRWWRAASDDGCVRRPGDYNTYDRSADQGRRGKADDNKSKTCGERIGKVSAGYASDL